MKKEEEEDIIRERGTDKSIYALRCKLQNKQTNETKSVIKMRQANEKNWEKYQIGDDGQVGN